MNHITLDDVKKESAQLYNMYEEENEFHEIMKKMMEIDVEKIQKYGKNYRKKYLTEFTPKSE